MGDTGRDLRIASRKQSQAPRITRGWKSKKIFFNVLTPRGSITSIQQSDTGIATLTCRENKMATVALTANELSLLIQLRAEAEGCRIETVDGQAYRDVYLDNVPMRRNDARNFAATLGSLTKKGIYLPQCGEFGSVDVTTEAVSGFAAYL